MACQGGQTVSAPVTLAFAPDGIASASLAERFSQVTRNAWDSHAFEQLFQQDAGKGQPQAAAASRHAAERPAPVHEAASPDSGNSLAEPLPEDSAATTAKPAAAAGTGGTTAVQAAAARGGTAWGQAAAPIVAGAVGSEGVDPAATLDPASATAPASRLAAPAAEWAARVVTIAGCGQGTEVYLRDSGLSASAAIDLASSLCQFFKDQGVQLNRLVVNGRRSPLTGDETGSPESTYS